MAVEPKRRCGYRKVGGLYLCAGQLSEPCHNLPFLLRPCSRCGRAVEFSRSFGWVPSTILDGCADSAGSDPFHCDSCPICTPELAGRFEPAGKFGLIWVGRQHYSMDEFTAEAAQLGVSRRVAAWPKGAVPGRSYMLVAHVDGSEEPCESNEHLEPVTCPTCTTEPDRLYTRCEHMKGCQATGCDRNTKLDALYCYEHRCQDCDGTGRVNIPAVFSGFMLQRVELIITPDMRDEQWVQEYAERGAKLIEVPEDDPDHKPAPPRKTRRTRAIEEATAELDD